MWDPQLDALRGFDVVRVDHPGHAGQPVVEARTVADLAGRLAMQVDADRFAFVGLSLGGAIGMELALGPFRERLERLVLACTSARFGRPEQWFERAETVRAGGMAAVADAVLARWFTPVFPDVRPYREMFLSTDPEGYARCCEAIAAWDARVRLDAIDVPTLAIAAEDDPATPPADLERIAREIPGARLSVISAARHLPNVERADEFNALLGEFL